MRAEGVRNERGPETGAALSSHFGLKGRAERWEKLPSAIGGDRKSSTTRAWRDSPARSHPHSLVIERVPPAVVCGSTIEFLAGRNPKQDRVSPLRVPVRHPDSRIFQSAARSLNRVMGNVQLGLVEIPGFAPVVSESGDRI